MPFIITTIQTRPSIDVPWYIFDKNFLEFKKTNFTGVNSDIYFDNEKLTRTTIEIFKTMADLDRWREIPLVKETKRLKDDHNKFYGIITKFEILELDNN